VGELAGTGLRPSFLEKFHKRGVKVPIWNGNGQAGIHPDLIKPENLA
jgi:hypothetical protein